MAYQSAILSEEAEYRRTEILETGWKLGMELKALDDVRGEKGTRGVAEMKQLWRGRRGRRRVGLILILEGKLLAIDQSQGNGDPKIMQAPSRVGLRFDPPVLADGKLRASFCRRKPLEAKRGRLYPSRSCSAYSRESPERALTMATSRSSHAIVAAASEPELGTE